MFRKTISKTRKSTIFVGTGVKSAPLFGTQDSGQTPLPVSGTSSESTTPRTPNRRLSGAKHGAGNDGKGAAPTQDDTGFGVVAPRRLAFAPLASDSTSPSPYKSGGASNTAVAVSKKGPSSAPLVLVEGVLLAEGGALSPR